MWYICAMWYYSVVKRNDSCYNMDGLWKHFTKYKKPDTEGHILYDTTYMNQLEQQICRTKQICGCPGLGPGEAGCGWFWGDEYVKLTVVVGAHLCEYTENLWMVCTLQMAGLHGTRIISESCFLKSKLSKGFKSIKSRTIYWPSAQA